MILDFRPRLGNRCTDSGHFRVFRASILDFRPRLGNRCTDSGDLLGFRASILDFKPRIGNHRSNGGLQAKLILVAATKIRVGRGTSRNGGLQAKPILVAAMKLELDAEIVAATAAEDEIFGRALLLYNLYYVNYRF